MCRLAAFVGPDEGRDVKELEKAFEDMDKSQGGDGMGVALLGKELVVKKAHKMTAAECAKIVAGRDKDTPALWHCRNATCGSENDDGCHPFVVRSRPSKNGRVHELVLVHNGSVTDWRLAKELLGVKWAWTDSQTLAYAILMRGRSIGPSLAKWGAIIYAERYVTKDKSTPWHIHAIRIGRGDLAPMEGGGVVSSRHKIAGTSDKETVSDKWLRLHPGKMVPTVTYANGYASEYSGGYGRYAGQYWNRYTGSWESAGGQANASPLAVVPATTSETNTAQPAAVTSPGGQATSVDTLPEEEIDITRWAEEEEGEEGEDWPNEGWAERDHEAAVCCAVPISVRKTEGSSILIQNGMLDIFDMSWINKDPYIRLRVRNVANNEHDDEFELKIHSKRKRLVRLRKRLLSETPEVRGELMVHLVDGKALPKQKGGAK